RFSMRYWPVPSVTTDRTRSISAGLVASTVTPGSTAPDESLTTPVMDAWAYAAHGMIASHARTINASRRYRSIDRLLTVVFTTPARRSIATGNREHARTRYHRARTRWLRGYRAR